jgi:hypothetical protein
VELFEKIKINYSNWNLGSCKKCAQKICSILIIFRYLHHGNAIGSPEKLKNTPE